MALELTDRALAVAQGESPEDIAAPEAAAPPAPAAPVAAATNQPGENPPAATGSSGGSTEAADSPDSWLNDDRRALGKSAGLSDEELGEFETEAEFNRAIRLIDKQFASIGQAARQPADPTNPGTQDPTPGSPPPGSPPPPAQAAAVGKPSLSRVDVAKLKEAGYDDDAIAELSKLNSVAEVVEAIQGRFEQIEQQFSGWQQQQQQAAQQQQLYDFHAAVDALDDPRFGKAFDSEGRIQQLTNEQLALRARIGNAAHDIASGHVNRGAALPAPNILVQRARNYAFAEEIRKEEASRVQRDYAEQSKKRRPVARQSRNPIGRFAPAPKTDEPLTLNQEAKEFYNQPEISAAFNRLPSVGAR